MDSFRAQAIFEGWSSSEYLPHTLMQEASENKVTYAFPHESYNTARYKNQRRKYNIDKNYNLLHSKLNGRFNF